VEETRLPNFLIAGAPKSGTTAIYHFLRKHPQIFLPEIKEPNFFTSIFRKELFQGIGDQRIEERFIKSFSDYSGLFENVSPLAKAIGEASVYIMYYFEQTIPELKKYLGDPRIIIILRNPVDRAFSAYTQLKNDKRETLTFRKALDSEEDRITRNFEFLWHYKNVGLYANQVKSFKENFSNVKVYLYDDLRLDPDKLVTDLLRFLEVRSIKINSKKEYNKSGEPYLKDLHDFIRLDHPLKTAIRDFIPRTVKRRIRILNNRYNLRRTVMSDDDKRYLNNYFREDMKKLEVIIDRNLYSWMA